MKKAIERYLVENYDYLPDERVPELAEMIENYMVQFAIPDIISDFGGDE